MPQHLWQGFSRTRFCEVCLAWQAKDRTGWAPEVHSICPGDDDDDGARGRGRRRPLAPAGGTPTRRWVLEPA
jgi:hypothetical protein